jgi:hypothetical protein
MPLAVATALAMQMCALALLVAALRRRFFSHIGAMLVAVMVAYHGAGELLQRVFAGNARFRAEAPAIYVERWMLLVSAAILVYTGVYLAVLGRGRRNGVIDSPGDRDSTLRFFDWRVMLLLTLPLVALTAVGRGLAPSADEAAPTGYIPPSDYYSAGLSSQFLVLGIVLVAYALVARSDGRWFVRVLIGATLPVALIGQRALVAGVAVLLFYALARHGFSPSRRQLWTTIGLVVIAGVVISAARTEAGRSEFGRGAGPVARVIALIQGTAALASPGAQAALVDDYVYRLDGNAYGALLLRDFDRGAAPVGTETLENAVALAVPSALNPAKLGTSVEDRSEKAYIGVRFGMSEGTDRLPTLLGTMLAYYGPWWLLLLAGALAGAFAMADRWLKSGQGPIRLLASLGLLSCVLSYEAPMEIYPVTLRGVVVLLVLAASVQFVRSAVRRRNHRPSVIRPRAAMLTPSSNRR